MLDLRTTRSLLGSVLAVALLAGCSNDPTINGVPSSPSNFAQLDGTGRSFAVVLFAPWNNHDADLRAAPGSDGTLLTPDVLAFMTNTAGRSQAIADNVNAFAGCKTGPSTCAIVPDVLIADLSQPGLSSFLGVETAGKLNKNGSVCGSGAANATPCTGGLFGGRGFNDDVGAAFLGLAFGATVPQLGFAPDDGKEQDGTNGTANLANDNVGPTGNVTPTFPYFGNPF